MKLKDYRNDYYALSGKASDVARQLAFAGIAIVWIFKVDKASTMVLPAVLLLPTEAFVIALSFDLLHYIFATSIWGGFSRYHERYKGVTAEDELRAPHYLNWPALTCFWLKLLSVFVGYCLLFRYVWQLIKWS